MKNIKEDGRVLLRGLESFVEVFLLTVLYYLFWRHGYNTGFPPYLFNGKYVLMGVYSLVLITLFRSLDCFKFGQAKGAELAIGQALALLGTNFLTYFQLSLIANRMVSPLPLLFLSLVQIVLSMILIIIFKNVFYRLFHPRKMLLIYGREDAVTLKLKMDTRTEKYNVSGLISAKENFQKIIGEVQKYDAVILNDVNAELRNDILKYCYQEGIVVYLAPKLTDILIRGGKNMNLFDTPLLYVKQTGLSLGNRFVKRLIDIILSCIALIVLSPVMLIVAIAIRCEDGGPAFYKQKRLTVGDKEFEIYKFRSMRPDAEKFTGAIMASENDPRITKVGKFIRATRLDELPQLINIFKGEMSFVGPRPERRQLAEKYCKEMPEFAYRTKVKGGLTGFAQVYGKYNTSCYDKLRLDLMYIENYSLLLDIKLLILTVKVVFSKESTEGIDVAEKRKDLVDRIIKEQKDEQN